MMSENFNIRAYVELDAKNRAVCPLCIRDKGKRNLSVRDDGAYYCHRCTQTYGDYFTTELRLALGVPKQQTIPAAFAPKSPGPIVLAQTSTVIRAKGFGCTVSADQIREDHERLQQSKGKALDWLARRGFTPQMIDYYQIGITRFQRGAEKQTYWGISIPIPATDGSYYRKSRLAPWITGSDRPDYLEDWNQKGITKQVFFTWNPPDAQQTFLCEGEWDAMMLGWRMMNHPQGEKIAVASFTCGCGAVPDQAELLRLPGQVIIFYDRNDDPAKDGRRPGEEGAKKVAIAIGDRALIGSVPMLEEDSNIKGWDISDALTRGFDVGDIIEAAKDAAEAPPAERPPNALRDRLVTFAELVARTPDTQEWLVPGLLTSNELFIIAAGPRQGKSLIGLTLAHAIATGGNFLGRPVPQGKIIYANLEDSDLKVKERLQAQGWSNEAMENAYALDAFKLSEIGDLEVLAEEINPRLIVLDTLSRIRDDRYSEDKSEMGKLLEPLQDLARRKDCCVIVIHHTTKVTVENADSVDIFSLMRGSGAIRATARGSWILASAPGGIGQRLFVEHGWGKEDLRVFLDEATLEWKAINEWNPQLDENQKERVLQFLLTVGKATVLQVATDCNIPTRSVGTILSSLQSKGLLKIKNNTGRGRIAAVYVITETCSKLKQIETELKHGTTVEQGKDDLLEQNGTKEKLSHSSHSSHSTVTDVNNVTSVNPNAINVPSGQNTVSQKDSSVTSSFNSPQNFSSSSDNHIEPEKKLKVNQKCKAIHSDIYGIPDNEPLTIIRIDDNMATVTFKGCRSHSGVDIPLDLLEPLGD
jgi:predicted transcriptional regulator